MAEYIIVETTTDSPELAGLMADRLVKKKLAACVQIGGPITSVYPWDGKIQRGVEIAVSIKTRKMLFGDVARVIRDMHTYHEPQIIALEIVDGARSYLNWIESETNGEV